MERVILHSDLNNFYASVECLHNPELRGKPVAVGGDPEKRHGIVLAKNYLAKQYGVKTGDALWQAQQKCPDIVFVPPDFDKYMRFSGYAREIYNTYTDQVEPFGIDECWLDVTGSKSMGSGKKIADEIRERMKSELGITASVGVSYNKIFAKLGSDLKKPDATSTIYKEDYRDIAWKLPVEELLCVGSATKAKLHRYGIMTIGDLAKTDIKFLERVLGQNGRTLWIFANGYDLSEVAKAGDKCVIKSVGNSTTTPRDLETDEDVKIILYALCESVSSRLRDYNYACCTVQISIRDNQLHSYERQGQLSVPNRTAGAIFDRTFALYKSNKPAYPIRSLGVRACNLFVYRHEQLSLLPDEAILSRYEDLETAIDGLRNRFGHYSLQRGVMLSDPELSRLDPKGDHLIHPESFFR